MSRFYVLNNSSFDKTNIWVFSKIFAELRFFSIRFHFVQKYVRLFHLKEIFTKFILVWRKTTYDKIISRKIVLRQPLKYGRCNYLENQYSKTGFDHRQLLVVGKLLSLAQVNIELTTEVIICETGLLIIIPWCFVECLNALY